MLDFKIGDNVIYLRDPNRVGTVTKIIEQFWEDKQNPFDRLPDCYEVTWSNGSITIESQWSIDPLPFEPNNLLKDIIT